MYPLHAIVIPVITAAKCPRTDCCIRGGNKKKIYRTNNLHIQIHVYGIWYVYGISPLLHISAADCQLQEP